MNKEIKTAIEAAIQAGERIMQIYDSPIDVVYKEDDSPLTRADKESNAIINTFLIKTQIPIKSEENKADPFTKSCYDKFVR